MSESYRRCAAALGDLESVPCVSVAITMDGTTPVKIHVCEVAGAELAGLLAMWFQSGGWRSIRIVPKSGSDVPGIYVES